VILPPLVFPVKSFIRLTPERRRCPDVRPPWRRQAPLDRRCLSPEDDVITALFFRNSSCLYYKSFTIVSYDHTGSGQYYKTINYDPS
jgi:hypothetical protein